MSNLYIVSTPIGNLEDITLRALRILKEVPVIYCEDTRVSLRLLNHYQIEGKKLVSFNKENEGNRIFGLLKTLDAGEDIALISDAGTPLVSDPGYELIKKIFEDGKHTVIPIPGASSLTAVLSSCPINCERFIFEGFFPHGPKQRRRVLKRLVESNEYPIVFFESPHRLVKTLEDIKNIFGPERKVFIAREITKKFEQFYFATIEELCGAINKQFIENVQGELVLVLDIKFALEEHE